MLYFNPQINILNPTGFLIYGRSDEGQLDVLTRNLLCCYSSDRYQLVRREKHKSTKWWQIKSRADSEPSPLGLCLALYLCMVSLLKNLIRAKKRNAKVKPRTYSGKSKNISIENFNRNKIYILYLFCPNDKSSTFLPFRWFISSAESNRGMSDPDADEKCSSFTSMV